jgi:hypothetical protein
MELGGNRKANEFFTSHGWVNSGGRNYHNEKYSSQAAISYKAYMQEVVNNFVTSRPVSSLSYPVRFVFECFLILYIDKIILILPHRHPL